MKHGSSLIAAALLVGGSAAHAGGLLPAKLQPVVAGITGLATPVLAAAPLPALQPALAGLTASPLTTPAALPELPGLGDAYWLDHMTTIYPGRVNTWLSGHALPYATAEVSAIGELAVAGDLTGATNRIAGVLGGSPPPPRPVMPNELQPTFDGVWNGTVGVLFGPPGPY